MKALSAVMVATVFFAFGCKSPTTATLKDDEVIAPNADSAAAASPMFYGTFRGNYSYFPADGSVDSSHLVLPSSDATSNEGGFATCYSGPTPTCEILDKMVRKYNDAQDQTSDSTVWFETKDCKIENATLHFDWTSTLSYDDSTTTGHGAIAACDMSKFQAMAYLQTKEKGATTIYPSTTKDSVVGGTDYFSWWTKTDPQTGKQVPNPNSVECAPDKQNPAMKLCKNKRGHQTYGGRFAGYCFKGDAEAGGAIFTTMVSNAASFESGPTATRVRLDGVRMSKSGKSLIVAYRLGQEGASFEILRRYAIPVCHDDASANIASRNVTTLYFPSGEEGASAQSPGTYVAVAKGSKAGSGYFGGGASGKLADMNCNDDGCVLKSILRPGCFIGSIADICPMVKTMADHTNTEEHIFMGADPDACTVQGASVKVGVYGMNDYAQDDEADRFTGTAEVTQCAAGQYERDPYVAEVYDDGSEYRRTVRTKSPGSYWLYTEETPDGKLAPSSTYMKCDAANVCKYSSRNYYPFSGNCYSGSSADACKVLAQMSKNAATQHGVNFKMTSCKESGPKKRVVAKWEVSGGKLTFTLKTGASLRMCTQR